MPADKRAYRAFTDGKFIIAALVYDFFYSVYAIHQAQNSIFLVVSVVCLFAEAASAV